MSDSKDLGFGDTLVLGTPWGGRFDTGIGVPSWFNAAMAGAGKSVYDTGRGLKQRGLAIADFVAPRSQTMSGLVTGKPVSRAEEYQREIDAIGRQDEALMQTTPGMLGNVGGQIAQYAIPAGPLARVASTGLKAASRTAASSPAVSGALNWAARSPVALGAAGNAGFALTQPVMSNQSLGWNTGVAAVTGGAGAKAGDLVQKWLRPANQVAAEAASSAGARSDADLAKRALDDYGVSLRRGQVTGSDALEGTGKLFGAGRDKSNQRVVDSWSKAVARTMGEDTPVASRAVLQAQKRLGDNYNRLTNKYDLLLTQGDLHGMQGAIGAMGDTSANGANTAVAQKEMQRIIDLYTQNGGKLPGREYQRLRSEFTQKKYAATTPPELKSVYENLRDTLDDAMTRSINASGNPADAALWAQTNAQYRAMKAAQQAVPKEPTGPFDPERLYNAMFSNTKNNRANRSVLLDPEAAAPGARPGESPIKDLGYLANIGAVHVLPSTKPTTLLNVHGALQGSTVAGGAAGLAYLSSPDERGEAPLSREAALGLGASALLAGLTAGRRANVPAGRFANSFPAINDTMAGALGNPYTQAAFSSGVGAIPRAGQAGGAPAAPANESTPAPGIVPPDEITDEMKALLASPPAQAPAAQGR